MIELPEIVHQKLHDPSPSLSPEDSLKVLLSCIKYGAVKGRRAKWKELLMVIGNTGVGKNTLINYLHGCEMERVFEEDCSNSCGLGRARDDEDWAGHTNKSDTLIPAVESD